MFFKLHVYSSKPDTYGNSYHAIQATSLTNGATVTATISGNNARAALFEYFGKDWEHVRTLTEYEEYTLPIRRFNALTKQIPHAGCTGAEIVSFLQSQGVLPRFWDCVTYMRDRLGIDVGSHYSDLYLPATPICLALCKAFGKGYEFFINQITGTRYIDVPLAYEDYWTSRAAKRAAEQAAKNV